MWRQSANHSLSLRWAYKTAPWEFQTKLQHHIYFMSNNKSNLHSPTIFNNRFYRHAFLYALKHPIKFTRQVSPRSFHPPVFTHHFHWHAKTPPQIHQFIFTLLFSPSHFHPHIFNLQFSPSISHPKSGWREILTLWAKLRCICTHCGWRRHFHLYIKHPYMSGWKLRGCFCWWPGNKGKHRGIGISTNRQPPPHCWLYAHPPPCMCAYIRTF